ncbi:MAG: alpha-N-arabinofuranosidase [Lachnospiraceae bacterium]|nr:alpha-N-arabinofuranosidase [Lachnospiraceae bacterium]
MAKLYINNSIKKSRIEPEIYGHFSEHLGRCIYEGIYVGEKSNIPNTRGMRNDVVNALRDIRIPVLRWPGGCFADEYHWMDGIGPKDSRKKMINTHWGGVVEDNSFGTHEFFELCDQLGCKTYINANVGSGTVREMSEWVEYMTFNGVSPMADLRKKNGREEAWKVDYIGVGNENWGCGGNMRPMYYADEYRRYQTYVRQYNGNAPIKKICCGANVDDYNWTKKVLATCFESNPPGVHGFMDGLSLHYYTLPETENDWNIKGSATDFTEEIFYQTLKRASYMEELVKRHGGIMDEFDPDKKIGMIVDEWGVWSDVEPGTNPGFLYQQNTMRDALVAGITLNIFNKNSDRVKMANIAQMVNVLQSVILTDGEKMIKTPTYHVFSMYADHQGADLLDSELLDAGSVGEGKNSLPRIYESVSGSGDGSILITLTNNSLESSEQIDICLSENADEYEVSEAKVLKGAFNAHNTFEQPDVVRTADLEECLKVSSGFRTVLPACSVTSIHLKKRF